MQDPSAALAGWREVGNLVMAVLRRIEQWRDGLSTTTILAVCWAWVIFSWAVIVLAVALLIWRSI